MRNALNFLLASFCVSPAFAMSLEELGRDSRDKGAHHHLRISYGGLPKNGETTVDVEGLGKSTSNEDSDKARRFTASYLYQGQVDGLAGFGLGFGFVNDRWSSEENGAESVLSVNGLQVEPQLVVRPVQWLALEFGLQLGVGAAKLETTDQSNPSFTTDGVSTWYGIVARPVVVIGGGFEVFAEGGWLSSTSSTKGQVVGLDIKVDSTVDGGYAAVGIGAAF